MPSPLVRDTEAGSEVRQCGQCGARGRAALRTASLVGPVPFAQICWKGWEILFQIYPRSARLPPQSPPGALPRPPAPRAGEEGCSGSGDRRSIPTPNRTPELGGFIQPCFGGRIALSTQNTRGICGSVPSGTSREVFGVF